MITLKDALDSYCYEHKLPIPTIRHQTLLGYALIEEWKKERTDKIEKTSISIEVNSYPDDFAICMYSVIKFYFTDMPRFMNLIDWHKKRKPRFFNYNIDDKLAIAFEKVAPELGFRVNKNFSQKGKTQYKMASINPEKLIDLGIAIASYGQKS